MQHPLGILIDETSETAAYAGEVFAHAGLFVRRISRDGFKPALGSLSILFLAGDGVLADEAKEALRVWVRSGGRLIAVGGTWGLEPLLGVRRAPSGFETGFGTDALRRLGEGSIQIDQFDHPVVRDLASSLHTFRGTAVQATDGTVLARMRNQSFQGTDLDAIVERHEGNGGTLLIAPDLWGSILRIQQGTFVDQDGIPADDGTASIDDGILKCEDGMVLRYDWDRTCVDGTHPIFYHPVADELRELVIRAALYMASQASLPLPMLWYYPRNLPALGHISHDSDGNDPELARRLLHEARSLGIRTTWCVLEPGYPREFYRELREGGYEIALHFDALEGRPRTSWCAWALRGQYDWLYRASETQPLSNKNHYTRWEGRLDFFRWCADVGIQCDQSKGPSKQGTIGYPFGGCHPWFPMERDGTFIDCLELNLQTQDLVVTSPDYFGRYWVDQARRYHGVAHLLFHPAHIAKPGVADALEMVVNYGREKGLEWWSCGEINAWERARRRVRLVSWEPTEAGYHYQFAVEAALTDATLLFLKPEGKDASVIRYGFPFEYVVRDLEGDVRVELPLSGPPSGKKKTTLAKG